MAREGLQFKSNEEKTIIKRTMELYDGTVTLL